MTNYSNPRMRAEIKNYPLGGDKRGTATYYIEQHSTRGERAVRVTIGKAKCLTYAEKARIVDGDDGRTYIAELSHGFVSIMKGDMKYEHEVIHSTSPRLPELLKLFD